MRHLSPNLAEAMLFAPGLATVLMSGLALIPREQPVGFEVREGEAFVAPPSSVLGYIAASQIFLVAYPSALLLRAWRDGGPWRDLWWVFAAAVALNALLLGSMTAAVLRARPRVEL